MEEKYASIRGIYRDILKDKNNNIIFDSGWNSNVIVNDCRIQLAAFMKNDQTKGIQCLKVGIGNPDWDKNGLPGPDILVESSSLVDTKNVFPVQGEKLVLVYLNENDVEVTKTTDRVQITATLGVDEPLPPAEEGYNLSSYPLREFGLFGGECEDDNGYMIDHITHPVIHKDVTATLIRVVRLYF